MTAVLRRALTLCVSGAILLTLTALPSQAATRPAAPTGVAVRTALSSAVVTWNAAKNATHYRVCLLNAAKACEKPSGELTSRSRALTGLTKRAGTDYYVRVYAYNGTARTASAVKGFELKSPVTPATATGIKPRSALRSIAVTWSAAARAKDYSVCLAASPTTTSCTKTSPRSSALTASFTGLEGSAGADYYVRVIAHNGTASARSTAHRVDLLVGSIKEATATNGGAGAFKTTWDPATNAESYELQVAANSSMTVSLKTYKASQTSSTPTLPIGTTWFYRVRGVNGTKLGAYTPVATLRLPSTEAKIRVMTYNLCGQDKCVTKSNGMKKWSTRKTYAGRIVRGSDADIIATQESHDEDTRFGRELPGFTLAAYYSAKSLFYDTAKYDKIRSGTITLSSKYRKYAVWAELRDATSRNRFIVVDAHLQPYKGKTNDDLRSAQSKVLLAKVAQINTTKLSVIYAGDFNSNKSNADQSRYKGGYDAPLKVFLAAGIPDTYSTAAGRMYADFNSANQAKNPPLRHSDHVDHIYADPEVAVDSWRVWVSLNGKNYATPFATDHNPVRTILRVPGR